MEEHKKRLLIVYHSQSGRNESLAYAAAKAARAEEGVAVRLRRAPEAGARDIEWADAAIFYMPENFGALAGGLKDFFDRVFYPVIDKELTCVYSLFLCTGNDGSQALLQLQRILKGLPFREISEPVIVRGEPDEDALAQSADLGAALAAGLSLGIY